MPSHFSKWLSSFTESITSPLLSSINNKLYKRQLKASLSHFIDLGNVEPVWIDGGIKIPDASLNTQHITNALSDFSLRLSYSKLTSLHVLVEKQNSQSVMKINIDSLQMEFHLSKEIDTRPNESLDNSALTALRDILERLLDTIELGMQDLKIYLVDARNLAVLLQFKGVQYRHTPGIDGNSNTLRRTLSCESIIFHTADLRNGIEARTAEYEPIFSLGTEPLSVDFGQCHRHKKSSNSKKLDERRKALEISGTCNIHGCIRPGQICGLLHFADHWSDIAQKSAEQISLWTELAKFCIKFTCHKVIVLLIPDSSRQDAANTSILDQFHSKPPVTKYVLPLTCDYTQIYIEDLLATLQSNETPNTNSLNSTLKATDLSTFNWKKTEPEHIPIPTIILDPNLSRAYTSSHTNPKNLTLAQRRCSNFPDIAVTDWTYAECRERGVDLSALRTKARKTSASFNGFSISINFQEEGGEYFPMRVDVLLPPVQVYFDLRYLLHNNEARMFAEYMLERHGQRNERNGRSKQPSFQIQTDMLRLHIRCFPETAEDELTSGTLIFDIRNFHITRPQNQQQHAAPDSTFTTLLDLKFNLILASCTSLSSPGHASSFISSGRSNATDPTPCITLIDTNSPALSLVVNIPSTDILISETQLEDLALIMNDMKRVLGHSFHPVVSVVDDDTSDVSSSSGVRSEEDSSGQAVQMSAELPVGSEQTANAANLVIQDASMTFKLPANKFWGIFK